MAGRSRSVPSYRLHKQSGQAVVTLPDGLRGRRDVLLGRHGSPESRAEYARVIAEWEAGGRRTPAHASARSDLSVNELLVRFWEHAEQHYRHADGTPTSELNNYRLSLRPLRELYGHTRVAEFGPLALKAVRQKMVEASLCRGVVNQRVWRIKRVFRWAASEELVPIAVMQGLAAVAGLPKGRSPAPESEPVRPVPGEFVDAVQPYVTPHVWAMIELQRRTGMRPGEVCAFRACDLDTSGRVWLYRPPRHKTAWRGKARVVALGPKAQAVLCPFLTLDLQAPLFSPRRARDERFATLRAARKTKVQPSQMCRRKARPKLQPAETYSPHTYGSAVKKAIVQANRRMHEREAEAGRQYPPDHVFVPHWHPNQLRHNYATDIRRQYGIEATQVCLGHSRADVTQVYAEADENWMHQPAEQGPQQYQQARRNPHLPLQRHGLFAPDDGQTAFGPGQGAALDVGDVGEACGQELFARLPPPAPGAADDVQRLVS
jgi:integrase